LAAKGDFFNYLTKGGLPVPIMKHYATQLIQATHYMHAMGFAHRDLKVENILVDGDYNLKVADFGLSCNISGTTGNGFSNRFVGTVCYMAPEQLLRRQYQPQVVDTFALGVIFFMMYTGNAPFERADFKDPLYRLIALNEQSTFFKYHLEGKDERFFTPEFKDLISQMLALQPFQRLSMAEVITHPFFAAESGKKATPEMVRSEMISRENLV